MKSILTGIDRPGSQRLMAYPSKLDARRSQVVVQYHLAFALEEGPSSGFSWLVARCSEGENSETGRLIDAYQVRKTDIVVYSD